MNSTDPAFDRAAARSRSVSRHRNRVAARLALFQSALSSEPRSSSSGANGAFMGTNDQHSNSSLKSEENENENEQPDYIIRGTPGGVQYFGKLEEHCYWGNEVKLYERHVDALFAMFWHKEPEINYYVGTINKTFAKPGQRMYFQVNYTEKNLLDYIDPNNDTLMVRLANGRLRAECRIMVGTDKRATITTNWSEFRRRANIREGDICAFRFRVTSKRRLVLTVQRL